MTFFPSSRFFGKDAATIWTLSLIVWAWLALLYPDTAFAHASDRGHVLLLPTGYYIAGGALAVGASFLVLALLPADRLDRFWRGRLPLFHFGDKARVAVSLLSFAVFAILLAAGLFGSRDPLSNPLPLTIWTVLWVGLAVVQGIVGNIWAWLNPWYGICRLASPLTRRHFQPRYPDWLGSWPAVILFFGFAWFELVYPAPDDPARLAMIAGGYWLASLIAMFIFGYQEWSRRGEFLGMFLAMIARFSIFERDAEMRISLCWPGAKLLDGKPLDASGVAFILLVLSSVSFDGFSKTFFWLDHNSINPLEYPGRTAMMDINSSGLLALFLLLSSLFLFAVFLGQRMAGSTQASVIAAGLFIWSIVPIALAYHIAHYLTVFLVNSQYAVAALSDPFALGWNLFGTAELQIEAGIIAGASSAWTLWNIQAGAIIAGHVLAVMVAHGLAFRLHPNPLRAALSQFPLTLLMIFYTVFGLWLLSTPTAG